MLVPEAVLEPAKVTKDRDLPDRCVLCFGSRKRMKMNSKDFISVRQMRISELGIVRELILRTIVFSYAEVYPPKAVQFFKKLHSEENILERCRDGGVLVVEKDEGIVGTGSLVGNEILGVFILPEFQNQGHGRLLMRALEHKAQVSGNNEVELSISLPSRKFYESLGYEVIADHSFDVGEGQKLDYWQARKTLKSQEP
jgi:ribosomal protein S18 acetylase RimI-like enzyme